MLPAGIASFAERFRRGGIHQQACYCRRIRIGRNPAGKLRICPQLIKIFIVSAQHLIRVFIPRSDSFSGRQTANPGCCRINTFLCFRIGLQGSKTDHINTGLIQGFHQLKESVQAGFVIRFPFVHHIIAAVVRNGGRHKPVLLRNCGTDRISRQIRFFTGPERVVRRKRAGTHNPFNHFLLNITVKGEEHLHPLTGRPFRIVLIHQIHPGAAGNQQQPVTLAQKQTRLFEESLAVRVTFAAVLCQSQIRYPVNG